MKLYAILSNIPFLMSYRQSHTLITAICVYQGLHFDSFTPYFMLLSY